MLLGSEEPRLCPQVTLHSFVWVICVVLVIMVTSQEAIGSLGGVLHTHTEYFTVCKGPPYLA